MRLFSIGEDKRLVEYDVGNSTQDGLIVLSVTQIEQEANPTSCVWYPSNLYKEDCLLTVNSEYKIKLWQIMSNNSRSFNCFFPFLICFGFLVCKKTCLGPSYGHPINRLIVLNPKSSKSQYAENYLAYSTTEKVYKHFYFSSLCFFFRS